MDIGMEHGFVKAAAVTPQIKVADTVYNAEQIILGIEEAAAAGRRLSFSRSYVSQDILAGIYFCRGCCFKRRWTGF